MSILRKIPKIEQVLDNMSIESLKRLESLMNSGNGATETYTLFGGENKLNYVNKDLGVWYCNIELERNKSVETGFLIWESQTKALFISFDITQCLKEYEIDLTNYTYTKINEKLSIEEFRRVLEDNINKEVVHIDTTGNVEVGKNLVVGGKVILNGKQDLVDTSGNKLISGGIALLNIEPYLVGENKISQEGYNLVEEKINSGEVIGVYTPSMSTFYILYSFLSDNDGLSGFTFNSPLDGSVRTRITIKKDLSIYVEDIVSAPIVFEPTINSVSMSNDDTNKKLTFSFNVSNFDILTYLTTLIENNKPFIETFYLKTPANNFYQMMFNATMSMVNASTLTDGIYHCFSVKNAATDLKCVVSYGKNTMTLNIFLSDQENYNGFKQLVSALFTTDTKIKITIKTDE